MTDARFRLARNVALTVVTLDQLTKTLVAATIPMYHEIPLLPVFSLTYVRNRGAAFSTLAGAPEMIRVPFFLGVTLVAMVVLVTYLRDTPPERRWLIAAFGGILGGAIGNLICRIRFGEVVDFLLFHWGEWQFPVFNVADSAITVGVAIVLLHSFLPARDGALRDSHV